MIVRRYIEEKDYDEVKELVESSLPRDLPRNLGGLGIVLIDEDKIIAFAWALVAKGSCIGCVEFFVVDESKRQQRIYGPTIMVALLTEMKEFGVKNVIGYLTEQGTHTDYLLKVYNEVGMIQCKGVVVNGDIEVVLGNIFKRYDKGK